MDRRRHSGSRRRKLSTFLRRQRLPRIEVLENRQLLSQGGTTMMSITPITPVPDRLRYAINEADQNSGGGPITIEPGVSGLGTIYPRTGASRGDHG